MNGRKASLRGFTLMELLVVIAIIALLVSILMPSLQAAKSLARTAVYQANVHRIALGNGMYMADNDGFSVHGKEAWQTYEMDYPNMLRDTGYEQSFMPSHVIDDDFGYNKKGFITWTIGDGSPRNQWNNGGQNFPGTGRLMYDKYIEESAAAIGCPQADFTEITPFSGDSTNAKASHNYQYIIEFMGYPKLDPNKNYPGGGPNDPNTDPNAYWRNDYYDGSTSNAWKGKSYASSYIVRGPLLRSGDVLDQYSSNNWQPIGYWMKDIPTGCRSKADSQVAIIADHEWAHWLLGQLENAGALEAMGYDKPAWTYFPRRHTAGPVVAYTDGHAAIFQDESRRKTWNHDGKYHVNETRHYGNGWAMLTHIFDEQ